MSYATLSLKMFKIRQTLQNWERFTLASTRLLHASIHYQSVWGGTVDYIDCLLDSIVIRTCWSAMQEICIHRNWERYLNNVFYLLQEVSRWFFRVGGAAGTIAKSVSAYGDFSFLLHITFLGSWFPIAYHKISIEEVFSAIRAVRVSLCQIPVIILRSCSSINMIFNDFPKQTNEAPTQNGLEPMCLLTQRWNNVACCLEVLWIYYRLFS